jgi:hypothetical protein
MSTVMMAGEGGAMTDLGFFSGGVADDAAPAVPFGTPAVPFGTPAATAVPRVAPPAPGPDRTRAVVASVLLVTLVLLAVGGVLGVRAWKATGSGAVAARTTVATPATIGSFARASAAAPTLLQVVPDLTAVTGLDPMLLATYASGAVSAEVLTAKPVTRMDTDTISRLTSAFAEGVDRVTGLPPELAPAGLDLAAPLSCSQVELGPSVGVACVSVTSGSVTVILLSGQDYHAATGTAAQLVAGMVHRG